MLSSWDVTASCPLQIRIEGICNTHSPVVYGSSQPGQCLGFLPTLHWFSAQCQTFLRRKYPINIYCTVTSEPSLSNGKGLEKMWIHASPPQKKEKKRKRHLGENIIISLIFALNKFSSKVFLTSFLKHSNWWKNKLLYSKVRGNYRQVHWQMGRFHRNGRLNW